MEDLKDLLKESIDTDTSYNSRGPLAAVVDDNSGTIGVLVGGVWSKNDTSGRKKAQKMLQALGISIDIDIEDFAAPEETSNSKYCYIVMNGNTSADVGVLGDSLKILNEI